MADECMGTSTSHLQKALTNGRTSAERVGFSVVLDDEAWVLMYELPHCTLDNVVAYARVLERQE